MTFEQAIGGFIALAVSVIGYLVKRLISTIEERLDHTETTMATVNSQLIEILQRLVRLEERSQMQQSKTTKPRG